MLQSQESSILFWLLRRLATDPDTGVLQHVAECLTLLLDTETMEGQDRDRFLGVFYDHYMVWLVEPLAHIHYDKSGKPALPPGEEVSGKSHQHTGSHATRSPYALLIKQSLVFSQKRHKARPGATCARS